MRSKVKPGSIENKEKQSTLDKAADQETPLDLGTTQSKVSLTVSAGEQAPPFRDLRMNALLLVGIESIQIQK